MALEQEIMSQMKEAMKAKDEATLRGLRAIKAALLLLKTSGTETISEQDELKMLQKLVKQRQDSLEIFRQQNRADLAQKEEEEIKVIEQFLPQQLNPDELKSVVSGVIEEVGAKDLQDLGKVMAAATKKLAGQADGKMISACVKELLTK
jgi:uncharacterized protein YqeY